MGSAAEAEVAALHMNAQEAIPLRYCLEELWYEIYAVLQRGSIRVMFGQSCRILLGSSTGDFGRQCAVERGFIPIYIICVTFGDAPLDMHNLIYNEVMVAVLYLISVHANSIHGPRESVKREARYR